MKILTRIFDIIIVICLGIIILLLYTVLFYDITIARELGLDIELYIIVFLFMLFNSYLYVKLIVKEIKGEL